ncbi:MAG TPA: 2-C-methyl-D-erythritol 2,4-cyclodiphosphate synthase [Porphyromonadaceae bacterium]|nr:2-C-methyl-D-erythritol 2,4-cyclodiphosphate synthase [Porphyromonadaceae bacterium]
MKSSFRIGQGYDVHQLVEGRELWIGGIKIEHNKGLLGHSDADVLIHSLCDALLGAARLGDIGLHFPDTDPKYKNIDSKVLLLEVMNLLRDKGLDLVNADITLCAEKPKIKPYIPQMIATLSKTMNVEEEQISIKATTTEKLGFVGREEGMACFAVVLLEKEKM